MSPDAIALIIVGFFTAVVQCFGIVYAGRNAKNAKQSAENAVTTAHTTQELVKTGTEKVKEVQASVGESDGDTIKDLIKYQHKRNHDILDQIYATNMRLDVLGRTLGADLPPVKEIVDALRLDRSSEREPDES